MQVITPFTFSSHCVRATVRSSVYTEILERKLMHKLSLTRLLLYTQFTAYLISFMCVCLKGLACLASETYII